MVSVDCDRTQTFTCRAPGEPIGWNITGLSGINVPGPFNARNAAFANSRIMSNDTGESTQVTLSFITISGFSTADNAGIIQCVNLDDGSVQEMATISVGRWAYHVWKGVLLSLGNAFILVLAGISLSIRWSL